MNKYREQLKKTHEHFAMSAEEDEVRARDPRETIEGRAKWEHGAYLRHLFAGTVLDLIAKYDAPSIDGQVARLAPESRPAEPASILETIGHNSTAGGACGQNVSSAEQISDARSDSADQKDHTPKGAETWEGREARIVVGRWLVDEEIATSARRARQDIAEALLRVRAKGFAEGETKGAGPIRGELRILAGATEAVERGGFRVAPDYHARATLWCVQCGRDSGYHHASCKKSNLPPVERDAIDALRRDNARTREERDALAASRDRNVAQLAEASTLLRRAVGVISDVDKLRGEVTAVLDAFTRGPVDPAAHKP